MVETKEEVNILPPGPPPPGPPPPGPPPPGPPPPGPSKTPPPGPQKKKKKPAERGDMLAEIRNFSKGGLKKRKTKEAGNPYKIVDGVMVKNKPSPSKKPKGRMSMID